MCHLRICLGGDVYFASLLMGKGLLSPWVLVSGNENCSVGLSNCKLFVVLGVALLRCTDLAPLSGGLVYVDAWQEMGNGGVCCTREQPDGCPPFWVS